MNAPAMKYLGRWPKYEICLTAYEIHLRCMKYLPLRDKYDGVACATFQKHAAPPIVPNTPSYQCGPSNRIFLLFLPSAAQKDTRDCNEINFFEICEICLAAYEIRSAYEILSLRANMLVLLTQHSQKHVAPPVVPNSLSCQCWSKGAERLGRL